MEAQLRVSNDARVSDTVEVIRGIGDADHHLSMLSHCYDCTKKVDLSHILTRSYV